MLLLPALFCERTDDKEWKQRTREAAVESVQKQAEQDTENKAKTKQELGRFAVKKQMQVRYMGHKYLINYRTTGRR